jgi:hypothetical protein
MPIPIDLTPAQEAQLRSVAQQLGVAPEVLVRVAVEDLLGRPQPDYEEVSRRVLDKNRELYDRLS